MSSYREMFEQRGIGIIRLVELFLPDFNEADLLEKFGLDGSLADLRELNQNDAKQILTLFLWKDAAYQSELMPQGKATNYVNSLHIWQANYRYFTNGSWIKHFTAGFSSWTGLTEATFDGGIIAISQDYAVCFWFEDED